MFGCMRIEIFKKKISSKLKWAMLYVRQQRQNSFQFWPMISQPLIQVLSLNSRSNWTPIVVDKRGPEKLGCLFLFIYSGFWMVSI
jgi:hypothetical protein